MIRPQGRGPDCNADSHRGCIELDVTLAGIVYELLDAHDDTMRMAEIARDDERWRAHLEYLRALQRRGREILAHARLTSPP